MKRCSTCKQTKPLTEFTKNVRFEDGLHYSCQSCAARLKRESYHRNGESNRQKQRDRWQGEFQKSQNVKKRLKNYGLTADELEEMRARQDGRCGICSVRLEPGRSSKASEHVDHDHETGEVRSLLCRGCNTMIGCAQEHPDILLAGAAYLIAHSKERVS